jgi:hypothetical protein
MHIINVERNKEYYYEYLDINLMIFRLFAWFLLKSQKDIIYLNWKRLFMRWRKKVRTSL